MYLCIPTYIYMHTTSISLYIYLSLSNKYYVLQELHKWSHTLPRDGILLAETLQSVSIISIHINTYIQD